MRSVSSDGGFFDLSNDHGQTIGGTGLRANSWTVSPRSLPARGEREERRLRRPELRTVGGSAVLHPSRWLRWCGVRLARTGRGDDGDAESRRRPARLALGPTDGAILSSDLGMDAGDQPGDDSVTANHAPIHRRRVASSLRQPPSISIHVVAGWDEALHDRRWLVHPLPDLRRRGRRHSPPFARLVPALGSTPSPAPWARHGYAAPPAIAASISAVMRTSSAVRRSRARRAHDPRCGDGERVLDDGAAGRFTRALRTMSHIRSTSAISGQSEASGVIARRSHKRSRCCRGRRGGHRRCRRPQRHRGHAGRSRGRLGPSTSSPTEAHSWRPLLVASSTRRPAAWSASRTRKAVRRRSAEAATAARVFALRSAGSVSAHRRRAACEARCRRRGAGRHDTAR